MPRLPVVALVVVGGLMMRHPNLLTPPVTAAAVAAVMLLRHADYIARRLPPGAPGPRLRRRCPPRPRLRYFCRKGSCESVKAREVPLPGRRAEALSSASASAGTTNACPPSAAGGAPPARLSTISAMGAAASTAETIPGVAR